MIIILIIASFILFVCLILNFLKVIKTKTTKWFFILSIIFWVIYTLLFLATMSTQVISDSRKKGIICAFRNFNNNALYGNEGEEQFIGLDNEVNFYGNIQKMLDDIPTKKENFDKLSNADFKGTSQTLQTKVDEFIYQF